MSQKLPVNLTAAAYDAVIVAITIWREARGQSFQAKLAVAHVIRNRAKDARRWPDTPYAVCVQRWQFSCWNLRDPNALRWPRPGSAVWNDSCTAWEVSGGTPDPTGGANHYHSYRKKASFPKWAVTAKLTAKIGAFSFYRL